jgi:hypothetical protein
VNFLAHFHLSPPWPDALAGAYLGDFVRGPVDQHPDLPPMIRKGITLHRAIDAFTDAHPVWRRSCQYLQPERRRLGHRRRAGLQYRMKPRTMVTREDESPLSARVQRQGLLRHSRGGACENGGDEGTAPLGHRKPAWQRQQP